MARWKSLTGRSLGSRLMPLLAVIWGVAIAALLMSAPVLAADAQSGAHLFEVHCAGCHPNGGNIIRRGKTLKQAALRKNQVDTLEAIATLVANGKNNMSAFKDRLSPTEINTVSAYVLEQATQGWR